MLKRAIVLATMASVLAGCGQPARVESGDSAPDPTTSTTTTTTDGSVGGFGFPSQAPGEFAFPASGRPVSGVLQLNDDGCWYVEFARSTNLVIFPVGFEIPFSDDATVIVGPNGGRYASGTTIDGVVHEVPMSDLPGGPDGRWGNYVAFCDPPDISIATFDAMQPAFDPSALTDVELQEMISGAVFTKSWPCGRGWALSTDDEVVGLFVYQTSFSDLSAGATVSLPDEGWLAQVTVGKHLFVNHCDDVIEAWEPDRVIAGEWPLSGGTLEIQDAFPQGAEVGTVRAVLSGAQMEVPAGSEITLAPLDLVNTSFNAFAG